jgi:transcription initiation factor TFIID subunit 4
MPQQRFPTPGKGTAAKGKPSSGSPASGKGPSMSKGKEKGDKKGFSSSTAYGGDDDINDVAAMGGVNLAEESQKILGSTELIGTQIRSCRDEVFFQQVPLLAKIKAKAAEYGLEEPSADVVAMISHATEERIKSLISKLSLISEHRMDVMKMEDKYEITQDVKGQLRFLEDLEKLEKKRHDEQEREMLIKAAKSRSKSEDPEQAKLKAKAKEMQRVAMEELRQKEANLTALQAIGPRKKPKLDNLTTGIPNTSFQTPSTSFGASSTLNRPQLPLKPRMKRVNLRDLLFLFETEKDTARSHFLYKQLALR